MTLRVTGARTAGRLSAEVTGRLLQLGILVALARSLSQSDFGTVVVGATAGLVLGQVSDIGLSLVVGADVAQRHADSGRRVGSALGLKMVLLAMVWMGLLAFLLTSGSTPAVTGAILVAGALALDSIVLFVAATFRALGAFRWDWIVTLAPRVLAFALVVPVVIMGGDPVAAGASWGVAAATAAGVSVALLRRTMPIGRPHVPSMRALLRRSWPVGGTIVLGMLYTRVGVFLLPLFVSAEDVAIYAVAYNLVERTYLLPAGMAAVFYPAYAAVAGHAASAARQLRMWGLVAGGAGMVVYLVFVAAGIPLVVILFGGEYEPAGALLVLLGVVVIPGFVSFLLNQALIARGLARYNLAVSAILFAVSVAGNAVLIPVFSYWGSAAVAVVVELILLAMFIARLRRVPRPSVIGA